MSRRRLRTRAGYVGRVILALCAALAARAVAAEPGGDRDDSHSVTYRRIFVPADHVEAWPQDGKKYLPVEARDFETWVADANQGASASHSDVIISEAIYRARLDGEQLTDGRGSWTVLLHGQGPAFLELERTSLTVSDASWRDDVNRPVRIGMWGPDGETPTRMGLEVPRSGVLDFRWRAASELVAASATTTWRLPTAAINRLILDLPVGKRPVWEGSLVEQSDDLPLDARADSNDESAGARSSGPTQSANPRGWRRWELLAGPAAGTTLAIVDERARPTVPAPTMFVDEEIHYRITERGLDMEAWLRLENLERRQRQIVVDLPVGVQLVSASHDDRELHWRLASPTRAMSRAVIDLPERTSDERLTNTTTVVLRGWHALIVGKEWKLPRLQPADAYWKSGTIHISVSPLLELQGLSSSDCLQTAAQLGESTSSVPETCSFVAFSPTANIQVVLGQQPAASTVRMGTTLDVGNADVTGRCVSRFDVTQGNLHRLTGEVPSAWTVEAVETDPREALGDWYMDQRTGHRQIKVQLTTAAGPERPITVILTGRTQQVDWNEPLPSERFQMVRWGDAKVSKNLLLVHTTEPFEVEAVGGLPAIAPKDLTDEDHALVRIGAEGQLFDLTDGAREAGLRRATKRSHYAADIELDAILTGGELRQTYRLTIRPRSNRVDKVPVFSTEPFDGDVRWIDSSSGAELAAEIVPRGDARWDRLPSEGQLWQVRLPQSLRPPLAIEMTTVALWPLQKPMPLLALPEATAQDGRILIRVDRRRRSPQAKTLRIESLPLPSPWETAAGGGEDLSTWGAYQYQPVDCLDAARVPELQLLPSRGLPGPIVARSLVLESYFSTHGEAVHRSTYEFDDSPASVSIDLPAGGRLVSLEMDGQTRELPSVADQSEGPLMLELPAHRRTTLSLYFTTRQGALAAGSKLAPPPRLEGVAVLGGEWTIWLPEQYAVSGWQAPAGRPTDGWRQRLFGPLGRPFERQPFDPLRADAWTRLVARWSDEPATGGTSAGRESNLPTSESAGRLVGEAESARSVESLPGSRAPQPPWIGWNPYRRMFVAETPQPVAVAHPPATSTWAISIFLLCLLGGQPLRRARGEWFVGVTTAVAVLCLLLPESYAPLATGALLGLLASLVVDWPRRPDAADAPTKTWTQLTVTRAIIASGLLTLANAAMAQPVAATEAAEATPSSAIERVMIPVDSSRRPVGTKLYVSEPFLRELLRRSAAPRTSSGDWLIASAALRGELRQSADDLDIAAGVWSLVLGLDVLSRDTTIRLPLARADAKWPPTAQLDGVPLPLEWDADGRSATVRVAEPGRYRLTIPFVPEVRVVAGRSETDLAIPRLAGARVELVHPAQMTGLQIDGAIVENAGRADAAIWSGCLDGSGRLRVQWSPPIIASVKVDRPVTELRWLRIAAGGAELECKFMSPHGVQLPTELVITADRRWVLVANEDASIERNRSDESPDMQIIRVTPQSADLERGQLMVRWRLADPARLGRLPLPPIELVSPAGGPCWLGVTSGPSAECKIIGPDSLTVETEDEFTALWGTAGIDAPPDLVVGNVTPGAPLSLDVRPVSVDSSIDEVLHVAAAADVLRIQYQADVVPGDTTRFAMSLSVPPELAIDQVAVTQAGRPIELRWARRGDALSVFFAEELVDPYRVLLTAHVPTGGDADCELPRVIAVGETAAVERVHVYRDEQVLVDVRGPIDVDDAAPDLPPVPWNARLLAVYQLDPEVADRVRLSIRPNRVETLGETLTTLDHEGESWRATLRGRITVREGELDTLRLRVPATWVGPYEVQPPGAVATATPSADGGEAVLALRLADAVATGETLEFEIRGPLALADGGDVSVPEIRSNSASSWRSYVAVPVRMDSQPLTWTREGALPAPPLEELRASDPVPHELKTYRIISSPFHLSLAPTPTTQPSASIRLADTTVLRGPGGNLLVGTRLIVAPHRLKQCELQLPEGQELLSVQLDGQPARIQQLPSGRWAIALGPPELPQILDVVAGDVRHGGSSRRRVDVTRAVLLAKDTTIPVEMNLWSFGQQWLSQAPRVTGAAQVSDVEQSALRLERMVSIAESATTTALELPPADGFNWFRPWAEQLLIAQEEGRERLARRRREVAAARVALPAEDQLAQASTRTDSWVERCYELLNWPEFGLPIDLSLRVGNQNWPPGRDRANAWVHCVADGAADTLTIELSAADAPTGSEQFLVALAVVGIGLAVAWLVGQSAMRDALIRWPHAAGVLAGLFWWAWLWPSWLGVIIGAASLWLLLRPSWPGRAIRGDGSTVLQTGRSH